MRVTTAFNRALNLPGAWVGSVALSVAGIVIGLIQRRGYGIRDLDSLTAEHLPLPRRNHHHAAHKS